MGYAQTEKRLYTLQEYFELEKYSEVKHEFYKGEVFAMAGTTLTHNRLVRTIGRLLEDIFRPRGCEVFSESVKLEAVKNTYYPYPDVLVTCNRMDRQSSYTIANPVILVEVLSKSTAETDKDFKLRKYQKIPSLKHYLIVSQYESSVELYSRIGESDVWTYQLFESLTQELIFEELDFRMSLAAIYQDITFTSLEEENKTPE